MAGGDTGCDAILLCEDLLAAEVPLEGEMVVFVLVMPELEACESPPAGAGKVDDGPLEPPEFEVEAGGSGAAPFRIR